MILLTFVPIRGFLKNEDEIGTCIYSFIEPIHHKLGKSLILQRLYAGVNRSLGLLDEAKQYLVSAASFLEEISHTPTPNRLFLDLASLKLLNCFPDPSLLERIWSHAMADSHLKVEVGIHLAASCYDPDMALAIVNHIYETTLAKVSNSDYATKIIRYWHNAGRVDGILIYMYFYARGDLLSLSVTNKNIDRISRLIEHIRSQQVDGIIISCQRFLLGVLYKYLYRFDSVAGHNAGITLEDKSMAETSEEHLATSSKTDEGNPIIPGTWFQFELAELYYFQSKLSESSILLNKLMPAPPQLQPTSPRLGGRMPSFARNNSPMESSTMSDWAPGSLIREDDKDTRFICRVRQAVRDVAQV
jgi:hypothetical protein